MTAAGFAGPAFAIPAAAFAALASPAAAFAAALASPGAAAALREAGLWPPGPEADWPAGLGPRLLSLACRLGGPWSDPLTPSPAPFAPARP
jgi:hypothetical protein